MLVHTNFKSFWSGRSIIVSRFTRLRVIACHSSRIQTSIILMPFANALVLIFAFANKISLCSRKFILTSHRSFGFVFVLRVAFFLSFEFVLFNSSFEIIDSCVDYWLVAQRSDQRRYLDTRRSRILGPRPQNNHTVLITSILTKLSLARTFRGHQLCIWYRWLNNR